MIVLESLIASVRVYPDQLRTIINLLIIVLGFIAVSSKLSTPSCFYMRSSLITFLLIIGLANLSAATIQPEDPVDISDKPVLELAYDAEIVNTAPNSEESESNSSSVDSEKSSTSPLVNKESGSSPLNIVNQVAGNFTLENKYQILQEKNTDSLSDDFVRQSYKHLNQIVATEYLDDTVLIVQEMNTKFNSLDQSIDQHLMPTLEDLFTMQPLFVESGEIYKLPTAQYRPFNSSASVTRASYQLSDPELSDIPQLKSDGVFGVLLNLPKYLLKLENLLFILIALFLVTGIFKIVHYVVNRIY